MAEITEPEAIRARLGGPERRMFLAWQNNEVVGFAATRVIDEANCELAGIVVLQSAIGSGHGSPLLAAARASAAANGHHHMVVRTEADNHRALGFYESHGFVAGDTRHEEVEGIPVDLVELGLHLDPEIGA
jgi:ribosomal protein S18 acetylase RimI-like enzyme